MVTPHWDTQAPSKYASLWQRLYAFCLDAMILYFSLWTFAHVFLPHPEEVMERYFFAWGSVGWWVLFVLYRGVMESRLCRGQTFGKSVTGVCVVSRDGKFLSLRDSFLREGTLALTMVAFFLVGFFLGGFWSLLAFAVPLVVFLLDKKTKQSIHDFAAKTLVIEPPVVLHAQLGAKVFLVFLSLTGGLAITKAVLLEAKQDPMEAQDSWAQLPDSVLEAQVKKGDKSAKIQLAIRHLGSKDPAQSHAALQEIAKDAEQGSPEAELTMAAIDLALSERVPKLLPEATTWIGKAAAQGYPKAEMMMGMILLSGEFGMPKDITEGSHWLRKAADHGLQEARVALYKVHKKYPELVTLASSDLPTLGTRAFLTAMDSLFFMKNVLHHVVGK